MVVCLQLPTDVIDLFEEVRAGLPDDLGFQILEIITEGLEYRIVPVDDRIDDRVCEVSGVRPADHGSRGTGIGNSGHAGSGR